jgi:hypothetical protein
MWMIMTQESDAYLEPLIEAAARASGMGSLLFHLELAQMLAREHAQTVAAHLPIDDWAVDVAADGYMVTFLDDSLTRETLRVTFAADGRPMEEVLDSTPSPRTRALATANRRLSNLPRPVDRVIVIIPPADNAQASDRLTGYLIRSTGNIGDIAVGIHWKASLSSDGEKIFDRTSIGKSDFIIPAQKGQPAEDLTLTDLEGDAPNEIHVYLSLCHDLPFCVITVSNEEQWLINGERVSLL